MLRRLRPPQIATFLGLLVAVLFLGSFQATAQTQPGLIRGLVKDSETGQLLDYANVIIKGTARGTMTLGGGAFYFRHLTPGTYTIQVLYLGFEVAEQTVVLQPGQAVDLQFSLKVTIVETLQPFDVDAARYMVEVRSATTAREVGSERFERFAFDTTTEALSREAGVILRAGQLYVRGGRSGEVATQIDGISVDNPLGRQTQSVSTMAIQDMQMITGGLDAEYGNALSGVINITTRTGSRERFEGRIQYVTDDFGRRDRTFTDSDRFEYTFGGPSPIKHLTYNVSGDLSWADGENYSIAHRPQYALNVGDSRLMTFRRRQSNSLRGTAKLAYFFDDTGTKELTAEYTYSGSWNQSYSPNWSIEGYAQRVIYMPMIVRTNDPYHTDAYIYVNRTVPVYYGPWYENMHRNARPAVILEEHNQSFTRQVKPILEVRSAADNRLYLVVAQPLFDGFRYPYSNFSTVDQDSSYTHFNSADRALEYSTFTQSTRLFWRHRLDDTTFYTIALGVVAFDNKVNVNGKLPYEYNHGGVWSPNVFAHQASVYLTGDDYYTDQYNPLFITTSDQSAWSEQYSRAYSLRFDLTSARWAGHLVKTGFVAVYNDLEETAIQGPARMVTNRFTRESRLGSLLSELKTVNPEFSWWLQDRWEYEGMVVSFGLRWDMFSAGSAADINLRSEEVDRNMYKYRTRFSPRLGFAFPITERDGFHFHYGRFVQFPDRAVLFASQETVGNIGILGNPSLNAENTIQYQAGLVHQFSDYLAGTFQVYSRDIYNLIAAIPIIDPETGNQLSRYINRAYASARGIELTLSKRMSNNWAFDVNYTFAYADGVASDASFGANPDGLQYLPSQEMPLAWDQRHSASFLLSLMQPGAWVVGLDIDYGSGFPWTPWDRYEMRQDPMLEHSRRLPATLDVNIRIQREINVYGQRMTLQIHGFNLLNQDQVLSVQPGISPGLGGGRAQNAGNAYLVETGRFGGAFLQDQDGDNIEEFHEIRDPRVFGRHRWFRVGLGWRF